MANGKGSWERIQRAVRTVFFILTMIASLVVVSAPVFVAAGDVAASLVLASTFACARCYGWREHLQRYGFRSSLVDIPLVSVVRSLVIACVYSLCDGPGLSNSPYLGTATVCSFASIFILSIKACLFTPTLGIDDEASSVLGRQKLHSKKSWGMPVLFLSSLIFALGHVVVAYRTSCKARKLLFYRVDPEPVLACKKVFSGYHKVPRSPIPFYGKNLKTDGGTKTNALFHGEHDIPISLLADMDSLFVAFQGLKLHYKLSQCESSLSSALPRFDESISNIGPLQITPGKLKVDRLVTGTPKSQCHIDRSFSNQLYTSSLYAPLLTSPATLPTFFSSEITARSLDNHEGDAPWTNSMDLETDVENRGKLGIILVHGFGGGVFSWRHMMEVLARQSRCTVVAFDRPGWGLTSRPRRKDWEEKKLPNPYKLESQVDLLLSFCSRLGFSSVILVGHDDGGFLALKAAEKVMSSSDSTNVEIKGVVLLSVSLSREIVPAFARILLHTSLGKKHMVRSLLRTEITQVINRRAWYDATKLTTEVLNLYKAPLCVEGWDEALHEIGRLSFATVLSPQNAAMLLKSVENLPILVVAGAEDALVSLKSTQAMALKLVNSRLVAISGCGHLPHEECPRALLAALSPFITRLLSSTDTLERQ